MAQGIRPDMKLAKIVYKILQTDKTLQQKNTYHPTERQIKQWESQYSKSNMS